MYNTFEYLLFMRAALAPHLIFLNLIYLNISFLFLISLFNLRFEFI